MVALFGAPPIVVLVAMVVGGLIPYFVVWQRMRRRLGAFETQLPDMLITIAASLKAGHSFKQGLQAVVDEGQAPASVEFKRVLTETGLGRPIDDALADMVERVSSKNFEFAMTAVTIQRQVGGSLANLFDLVADTVRQRQQFARKIRSLTAMGRMSAYTLIGLPFFLMLAISVLNSGYLEPAVPHVDRTPADRHGARDDGDRLGNHPEDRLVQGVMTMLLLAAAVCLSISVLAVANLATLPARNRRARIRSAATYGNVKVTGGPERLRFSDRVVAPLVASLSRAVLRLTPKQNLESIAALLMSAGMRNTSPQAFLASKAACAIARARLRASGRLGLVRRLRTPLRAGPRRASATSRPAVIVNGRARRRGAQLVAALPDALDLLAVSVEAGLGFDAAIAKLTQHMKGPLSEEFELALGEMRIGESRVDALKKLSARAATPEIASFVRSIIQADQLGTSLGRILRVQAVDTPEQAAGGRRGAGDEGADQDAVPDGPVHLPGDVHRRARAGHAQPREALRILRWQ